MMDKVFSVIGTLAIAAVVTALVLPERQTPELVKAAGNAFANAARAATGQGS